MNSSFTKINKSKASKMAKEQLSLINSCRQGELEDAIKNFQEKWIENTRWYHNLIAGIFKRKDLLTRDEIIKELKNDDSYSMFSTYSSITCEYQNLESICNLILLLCKNSKEDYIYITGKDLMAISPKK